MKRLLSLLVVFFLAVFLLSNCSGGGGGGTNSTYTVTYDGNGNTGGSVPTDTNNYQQGQTVTVLGNTGNLVKTGYSFSGWNTLANGTGTTYTQAQTFTMGSVNVTLYAKWTSNPTYTVTYNGNDYTGGSVPIDTTNYEKGQSVTVLGNSGNLEKTGYSFSGWNTLANGSGTTYTQAQTFTMGSANVTLYAKWTSNPTYTLTYNGNGNTGGSVPIDTTNYEQGQIVTVLGNTGSLVKTGYSFSGWNTQANGTGTTHTEPQTFTMGAVNITLYAIWTTGPTYTVTYDGNGNTSGSVPIDTTNYVLGQTVAIFANPGIKAGYSFSGWNTEADGSGTTFTQTQTFTISSANITLYAMWTENVPRFLYMASYDYPGVSNYALDASTGRLKLAGKSEEWGGAGPITLAPSGKYAYIVNGNDNSISQCTISADGTLSAMIPATVAAGLHPGSVTIDPSGKYAYVANEGEKTVSQYKIGSNGALSPMTPATVVTGLYPRAVTVDPSVKYAYVANSGDNTFSQYKIGTNGTLSAMTPSTVASGRNPSSITIDPLGKFAYVAHYYDNSVSQYMINAATGVLSPMTPSTVAAGSGPFSITVDPSGKYAYVANLEDDTISQYSIDATSGALSPMTPSTVAVEGGSESVAVDPSGKYAYVVSGGGVSLYTIGSNGALTPNSPATIITQPLSFSLAISYGAPAAAVAKYAYVANYGDNTVSQYTISADGTLSAMTPATVVTGQSPNSVTVDLLGKYAYVANYGDNTISQYTISADGTLSAMTPATVATGKSPSFVTVDPSSMTFGMYIFVTNYSDGTISSYYDVGGNGSLYAPWPPATVATGLGPASATADPSGKYAYVANFSDNTVSQYMVDATGLALSSMTPSTVAAGSGPASVTADPSGKYAYVANKGDNSISQYTISATTGALSPMTPSTVAAGSGPSSVTVDPSGKYAYVANNGDNSISQYTISATTGALSSMTPSTVAAGSGPSSVTIDPSGNYTYVTNEGDNSISQYTISATTGALSSMTPSTVGAGLLPRAITIVGSYQ